MRNLNESNDLSKVLNVIAERLSVRKAPKLPNKEENGNDEVKVVDCTKATKIFFINIWEEDIQERWLQIEEGSVIYCFSMGVPNENLVRLFLELPDLEEGESYCFSDDVFIKIALGDKIYIAEVSE